MSELLLFLGVSALVMALWWIWSYLSIRHEERRKRLEAEEYARRWADRYHRRLARQREVDDRDSPTTETHL